MMNRNMRIYQDELDDEPPKQSHQVYYRNRVDPSDPSTYTYYNPILVKLWFPWKFIIFLIYNFYVIDCVLVPTFQTYYIITMTTLLPLNIVLLVIMGLDLIYKVFMIPKPEGSDSQTNTKGPRKQYHLKYYLMYEWYIMDVIVYWVFAIGFMTSYAAASVLRLIIIVKIVDIIKFNTQVYEYFHIYKVVRQLYTILKMMYVILLFSHYFGCIFYAIDEKLMDIQYFGNPVQFPQNYYQMVSLTFTPIASLSQVEKYIYGNYFATALITTIAYGDIVGKNYIEDIYVLFLLVVSTISIALILEQFMIMMQTSRFALFQIIKQYNCVKEFMNEKKVPQSIQNKVRSYLFYIEYQKNFYDHDPIVEKLSEKLQNDLTYEAYGRLFQPYLNGIGVQDIYKMCKLINQIAFQAQFQIYNPFLLLQDQQTESQIDLADNYDEEKLYHADFMIMIEGQVDRFIKYDNHSKCISISTNKNTFNYYEFITDQKIRYGLKTIELSKFVKIEQDAFEQYLHEDKILHKAVKMNRQKVLCGQISYAICQNQCIICDGIDHSFEECPEAHLVIHQNIRGAFKITDILDYRQKSTANDFKKYQRKDTKSTKILNKVHMSALFRNILPQIAQKRRKSDQRGNVIDLYLKSLSRSVIQISQMRRNIETEEKKWHTDSAYDPEGLDSRYQL